jgi:peptidoglycan hydrolase-like protein with peptidoglycan-binding domain
MLRPRARIAACAAAVLGALALPPGASAQGGPPSAGMRLLVDGAPRIGSRAVVASGQRLRLRGIVAPYVPGQSVTVRVNVHGRRFVLATRPIHPVAGHGEFSLEFRVPRPGILHASALHAATPQLGRLAADSENVTSVWPTAGRGAGGLRVVFLQRQLLRLGYYSPVTGRYGAATARAVLAFRRANRLGQSGWAGRSVFIRAGEARGRYRPYSPWHGRHAEVDLGRQVLALIEPDGRVYRVFPISSGKSSTPTVRGSFRVQWKQPGVNVKQMLHSNYFYGGYAIHGFPSVPNYPASHGCVRIPNANAAFVNRWLRIGTRVDVFYRARPTPPLPPPRRDVGP